MAAFVAADVTYTMLNQRKLGDSRNMNRVRLTFGAGSETYATGGIPLTIGKMGCPVVVESLQVVDKGSSGYSFMYDQSEKKLLMFVAPAQTHAHDLKIIGGQAATTDNELGYYATDILGKEAATNVTIAKADSATKGGVISETLAAAAMSELANGTDIATQTIEVEVIGW